MIVLVFSHAVACRALQRLTSIAQSSAWNLHLLTKEVPQELTDQPTNRWTDIETDIGRWQYRETRTVAWSDLLRTY